MCKKSHRIEHKQSFILRSKKIVCFFLLRDRYLAVFSQYVCVCVRLWCWLFWPILWFVHLRTPYECRQIVVKTKIHRDRVFLFLLLHTCKLYNTTIVKKEVFTIEKRWKQITSARVRRTKTNNKINRFKLAPKSYKILNGIQKSIRNATYRMHLTKAHIIYTELFRLVFVWMLILAEKKNTIDGVQIYCVCACVSFYVALFTATIVLRHSRIFDSSYTAL